LFQLNSWQPFKDQFDVIKVESFSIYAKKILQKKSTTFPPGYQHIFSLYFGAKKKREVHQFDLMASRLHIVSTVVETICQMYFGGLSTQTVSGESV
jgi:hypothetical protein